MERDNEAEGQKISKKPREILICWRFKKKRFKFEQKIRYLCKKFLNGNHEDLEARCILYVVITR